MNLGANKSLNICNETSNKGLSNISIMSRVVKLHNVKAHTDACEAPYWKDLQFNQWGENTTHNDCEIGKKLWMEW